MLLLLYIGGGGGGGGGVVPGSDSSKFETHDPDYIRRFF